MLKKSLIVVLVLLASALVFYGVVNNPLSIKGYYTIKVPPSLGGDFYVHLTEDKLTDIGKEDFTRGRSQNIECLPSDRPEFTDRIGVEGSMTVYAIRSPRTLSIHTDDGTVAITWTRVFNPIVLVRLALAGDK